MQIEWFLERSHVTPGSVETIGWVMRAVAESGSLTRVPLNLALVIDVSGSMEGEKLERVKAAACWVVQHLAADDTVSVVAFGPMVSLVSPAALVGAPEPLMARIEALKADGGTNLSGGWFEGIEQVRSVYRADAANRVLLLTDGEANRGVIDPIQLATLSRQARQGGDQPVSTTTVGVGASFNEDLLLDMAREGGGSFHYVASAEAIGETFRQELADVSELVAQNVTLNLKPSPLVKSIKQLTSHPQRWEPSGHDLTVRLGDVSSGAFRMVGLELQIQAGPEAQDELPLLSGSARWLDLAADPAERREQPLQVGASSSPNAAPASLDARVARDLAVLRIARARRRALQMADQGEHEAALALLALARQAVSTGPLADDPALLDHLLRLEKLENVLRDEPQTCVHGTQLRKEIHFETYRSASATVRTPEPGFDPFA